MGISDHLTCLLRNLYAGQKTTVRTGHGNIDWFQIMKEVHQSCILSPCLHAEYVMQNAGLDEAQAGIKFAGRKLNNLRYGDDTTLMAESKKRTKESFDESERGEWKSWLKNSTFRKLRSLHLAPSLYSKQMWENWKQWETLFSWSSKSLQMVTAAMKLKDSFSLK